MFSERMFESSIVATISFTAALWSWAVAAFSFAATIRFCISVKILSLTFFSRLFVFVCVTAFRTTHARIKTATVDMMA